MLVIVTAVYVNSQRTCPIECQCVGDQATCTDLFSDVTDMTLSDVRDLTQEPFDSGLRGLRVTGNTRLELKEDFFLRWKITSLTSLDLPQNNITKIWQRAFYSLADLRYLDLSGNSITTLHSQTFYYNTRLIVLTLSRNNITDIHPATFQNNVGLERISMDGNKITAIDPELFKNNVELLGVHLGNNRITNIHPSTFRNNRKLGSVYLRGNKIISINPETFKQNSQLLNLDLSNNRISDIHPSTFRNNSRLGHLDISRNKITFSFNFELYFPMNTNSDTSNPTFRLHYINVSANCLTTLDVASMKWLNETPVTDLTANPWNCDCSALLEVWRGLKHKLTLHCASPEQLQGKSWDVMEEFCSLVGGPSVVTTTLIVTGVLLGCAIGGGLILVKVVKRRRKEPKTPEYCDVYASRASYVSVHSYEEVGAVPSNLTVESYADVGERPSYITVQS